MAGICWTLLEARFGLQVPSSNLALGLWSHSVTGSSTCPTLWTQPGWVMGGKQMETRAIIQVIGMEATVLTFLFAMVFVAVRISVAERRANHCQ